VLGTQMERHIAKRLHIPCAVISGPFHVQDVPARHSPQMGWEGANVIFDTWVHPLMMGLEEHLIMMFREDFEFGDGAGSHLGGKSPHSAPEASVAVLDAPVTTVATAIPTIEAPVIGGVAQWTPEGERELKKIPFFVRKKARLNTEKFAAERGVARITVDTLYEAKAHYGK
jgi:light-independent protochlorophyllide reductase subunit B